MVRTLLISSSQHHATGDAPRHVRWIQCPPNRFRLLFLAAISTSSSEDIPKPQRFVRTGRAHHALLPTTQRQHATLVALRALELLELAHLAGTADLPQSQLKLTEAMARQEFFLVWAPQQRAHLAACVDAVNQLAAIGVPQLDALVRRATGEE